MHPNNILHQFVNTTVIALALYTTFLPYFGLPILISCLCASHASHNHCSVNEPLQRTDSHYLGTCGEQQTLL